MRGTSLFETGNILLESAHFFAISPGSLSDRNVVQVSENQEVWVKVVQLEDTSQQERSRKQDTRKQLHCVVSFQTQVAQTEKSYD